MADENVDLRFIGHQLQRVQMDLRNVQTDLRDVQVGLQDVREDQTKLRTEVHSEIANLSGRMDDFRDGVTRQFDQLIGFIREVYTDLKADIKALRRPD